MYVVQEPPLDRIPSGDWFCVHYIAGYVEVSTVHDLLLMRRVCITALRACRRSVIPQDKCDMCESIGDAATMLTCKAVDWSSSRHTNCCVSVSRLCCYVCNIVCVLLASEWVCALSQL
jgi:hypothetical protein